jgi:hypothetical protein
MLDTFQSVNDEALRTFASILISLSDDDLVKLGDYLPNIYRFFNNEGFDITSLI